MRIVIDIETDKLINPQHIWCIVCKDIDTGEVHVFREDCRDFRSFIQGAKTLIGHNVLEFDLPNISRILGIDLNDKSVCDTLIVSKLENYSRPEGHSLEAWGEFFGLPKIKFTDFKQWSQEMEDYCKRDVEINHKVYDYLLSYIEDCPAAIELEHKFQLIVNDLHQRGFAFNEKKAKILLDKITGELDELDGEIAKAFPPTLSLSREIHPKLTAHGTLHRGDFRFVKGGDLSEYNGGPFCRCYWKTFNPASPKQIVEVLNKAGWKPVDKTKTHILKDREGFVPDHLKVFGWKINENNLMTLPAGAPSSARVLARRILLESRRRTLVEWISLIGPDGRIHGKFYGIGAWTHRMAHQEPNTANIPNEFDINGKTKLYGKELRACWQAAKNRLLVGVDAEGIQLRIFAHYIDDPEFTDSLVRGKKDARTDPHSLNQRILGRACKSRAGAKRFVYALLLGAGIGKLGEILECSKAEAQDALDRLMERYQGFTELKKNRIPADAKRGWFLGLDGRKVPIPDETVGGRRHLAMSGYLQNGEAIIIKTAAVEFNPLLKEYDSFLVDIIHDEYQTEVPNDMKIALQVAQIQADAIRHAGEVLKLKCPMAGSYWNDDHKDYTIGKNWWQTH